MKLTGARTLPVGPEARFWFRAIQARFWPTALHTAHTASFPSRFNVGRTAKSPFEILYLAENHLVALFEVQALLGSPLPPGLVVPNPTAAWTVLNVTVQLQKIADLTLPGSLKALATTAEELTGDWRGYHHRGIVPGSILTPTAPAPTQDLGAALEAVPHLEGFLSFSARVPTHRALAVFPQKMYVGSFLEFSDPVLGTHRIDGKQPLPP